MRRLALAVRAEDSPCGNRKACTRSVVSDVRVRERGGHAAYVLSMDIFGSQRYADALLVGAIWCMLVVNQIIDRAARHGCPDQQDERRRGSWFSASSSAAL